MWRRVGRSRRIGRGHRSALTMCSARSSSARVGAHDGSLACIFDQCLEFGGRRFVQAPVRPAIGQESPVGAIGPAGASRYRRGDSRNVLDEGRHRRVVRRVAYEFVGADSKSFEHLASDPQIVGAHVEVRRRSTNSDRAECTRCCARTAIRPRPGSATKRTWSRSAIPAACRISAGSVSCPWLSMTARWGACDPVWSMASRRVIDTAMFSRPCHPIARNAPITLIRPRALTAVAVTDMAVLVGAVGNEG